MPATKALSKTLFKGNYMSNWTHELPVDPVVAEDGRVYEQKAWLQKQEK